jgi:uncharacterized protein YifN (PemK superfamily)
LPDEDEKSSSIKSKFTGSVIKTSLQELKEKRTKMEHTALVQLTANILEILANGEKAVSLCV